jgi:hypothetical protein
MDHKNMMNAKQRSMVRVRRKKGKVEKGEKEQLYFELENKMIVPFPFFPFFLFPSAYTAPGVWLNGF